MFPSIELDVEVVILPIGNGSEEKLLEAAEKGPGKKQIWCEGFMSPKRGWGGWLVLKITHLGSFRGLKNDTPQKSIIDTQNYNFLKEITFSKPSFGVSSRSFSEMYLYISTFLITLEVGVFQKYNHGNYMEFPMISLKRKSLSPTPLYFSAAVLVFFCGGGGEPIINWDTH